MENIYILVIFALVLLAVIDLVVGVSNDAVNFLNSAIGSKAIPIKKIMIIASIGIALGAISSSGMMEVARKGIFVPAYFQFDEIIWIFMAVMLTDVLLLDLFNMFGMPTSTTVSIVFELLGAAVATVLIKVATTATEHGFWDYINSAKALQIILGIFLSVMVAFTIGALVQYLSRILYSFNIEQKRANLNTFFGGFALTSIIYFIFIKALKGTPYYANIKGAVEGNTLLIIAVAFVICTFISFLIVRFTKVNILKVIIAMGTFSLAMAFAGNDLVNFIGVPLAAWSAYKAWHEAFLSTGVLPTDFSMEVLSQKVASDSALLVIAGLVMVVTLWFSKKAKAVINTGIDLSRQGISKEKFKPNALSRSIVRGAIKQNEVLKKVIPARWLVFLKQRFKKPVVKLPKNKIYEMPAFDMVRASVNLVIAAILISIGTSLKLPLSTTYVTFMVAMGTSLADKAWGQESAVYRVAGVFNVIAGWFLTAGFAFVVAGLFAYLLYLGGVTTMVLLLIIVLALMTKNYLLYLKNEQQEKQESFASEQFRSNVRSLIEQSSGNLASLLRRVENLYTNVVVHLSDHNLDKLKKSDKLVLKFNRDIDAMRDDIFYAIKSLDEDMVAVSKSYILILGHLQDLAESVSYIAKISYRHVNNNHKKLKAVQVKELKAISADLTDVSAKLQASFQEQDFSDVAVILVQKQTLLDKVLKSIDEQVHRIRTKESSPRNTTLYFGILLETKAILTSIMQLTEIYQEFYIKLKAK